MSALALLDILALGAAIPFAALGGEVFLRGILGLAARMRLPKLLVATTLVAFATSSPELTVSTLAALAGEPQIGLGNALGSNVVNISLTLGLALLFGALPLHFRAIRRDYLLALSVPVLTLLLALDGKLSRVDGALLLGLFAFWLFVSLRQAQNHRRLARDEPTPLTDSPARIVMWLVLGFACLYIAGRLFVYGASGIATALGVPGYIIGATIIAIGTTLPELVTTLLARLRGHDDIGLGTLLGSNLFNGMAIVGLAASIHPITIAPAQLATTLGFGMLAVLLIFPYRNQLSRGRGVALLVVYAAFVIATLNA